MLKLGQRLGDFEIVRLLGRGGMGEVYEAQQSNPSRRVALKVLSPWLASDDDCLQRFWREAEILAQLDHPCIVRIISTGKTEDGIAYFTMQLVRGVSLADLIRRSSSQPLPSTAAERTTSEVEPAVETPSHVSPPQQVTPAPPGEVPAAVWQEYVQDRYRFAARIGAQTARALGFAHKQGHLHRDIKPSNIMIDHHQQLYLVDFGLTRGLGPDAKGSLVGAVRGTPWYMSPEQARGLEVDQRSDVYSLGVTLYEVATQGVGPFTASRDNSEAVLAQVRAGQHLPLRMLSPNVPKALEQVIKRAMHYSPKRRYAHAEEMAAELEDISNRAGSAPGSTKSRSLPARRLTRVILPVGLVVLLGILLLAAWSHFASRPVNPLVDAAKPDSPNPEPAPAMTDSPYAKRPWQVALPLQRRNHEPVAGRKLSGSGGYRPLPFELVLQSPANAKPTMIALDDDPERRWFDFAIELRQVESRTAFRHELGVFFGWREDPVDPTKPAPFYVVQLDELQGCVRIGSGLVQEGDEAKGKGAIHDWLRPLPFQEDRVALPKPRENAQGWRQLRVQAVPNLITVSVDESARWTFDLTKHKAKMAQLPPEVRKVRTLNVPLDPRGGLGIWVNDGMGSFRNATIMALPVTQSPN